MNWSALGIDERRTWLELARTIDLLSDDQIKTLEVWATGCGYRVGARTMRIPRDTYRARVHRALDRLDYEWAKVLAS